MSEVSLTRRAMWDLFSEELPIYPEGLSPYPENYKIVLPAGHAHSVIDKVKAIENSTDSPESQEGD